MGMHAELPPDASAASVARRLVSEAIAEGALREDALIVVSELVANAWRHGETPFWLSLSHEESAPGLLISVGNRRPAESACVPTLTPGGRVDGLGGRGIDLVQRLASDWGWRLEGATMVVWAHLDHPASPAADLRGGVAGRPS
ncbi:MAG: ATP-binding protein [Actinomycetales bacterium]